MKTKYKNIIYYISHNILTNPLAWIVLFGIILPSFVFVGCDSSEKPYVYVPSEAEVKRKAEHEQLIKDMDKTIHDLELANQYLKGWNYGYDLGYATGYYNGLKDMKELMDNRKPLTNHPKK